MNIDNPLRIFTGDQLENIDKKSLNQFKNEILQRFLLASHSKIVINGQKFDKSQFIEIIKELENKLPTYLFINEHKSLSDFLENGSTALFKDETTIKSIKNLNEGKEEIEQKIVVQLQIMILELVKSPSVKYASKLRTIQKFIDRLNPSLSNIAYTKAYDELNNHINQLQEKFITPYAGTTYNRFNPDLKKYVNLDFYEMFDSLPNTFKPMAKQYSIWCNDSVVNECLRIQPDLNSLTKDSLYVFKNAAKIASNETNQERNKKLAHTIENSLDKRLSGGTKVRNTGLVILMLIFLTKIVIGIFNSSNAPRNIGYTTKENPQLSSTVIDEKTQKVLDKIIEEEKRKQEIVEQRITEYDIQEYGGEKKMALNAILVSEKEQKGFTELTFDVSVLPSKYIYFKFLLPPELAEKHKGEIWPIVMNFKQPQVKNSTLQHKVYFDFKSKKRVIPQKYIYKKSDSDQSLNLSIKKISDEKYPLNGVLSRTDSKNGEVLYSTKFQITYQAKSETYKVTLKPSNKRFTFTKDYISKMDPKDAIEDVDKFAIAIKNMNLIHNKNLQQGKMYTVEDVFGYTFEEFNETKFQSRKLISEKASLNYYITSAKDNTAYIEMNGQYVGIKYFTDYDSGEIKGMTMVNSSDSSYGMETMTIFSSK